MIRRPDFVVYFLIAALAVTPPGHGFNWSIATMAIFFGFVHFFTCLAWAPRDSEPWKRLGD